MTGSNIQTIGVIGAGTMGGGIAQVAAATGLEVILIDQTDEWLDRGLARIQIDLDRAVDKARIAAEERDATLVRISGSISYEALADADVVIEVVNEDLAIKTEVFKRIAEVVEPTTLILSNTSSISVTALAAAIPNPERVGGMHFFNPVPVMKLVEVIRGLQTADSTIATIKTLAETLGKRPVEVADTPGFVANRLLLPMINEAVFCLAEGVGSAEDIDAVMTLGAAHPMGPLALADLIGLDVCLNILEVLHRDFGDDKYRPSQLLRQMVAAGRLGRKTGQGFHTYAPSPSS